MRLDADEPDTIVVDSDNPDLQWDGTSFDYHVPFGEPILHETYPFERDYPNAAPLLRDIFALPRAQQASVFARAMHSRAAATLSDVSEHLDRAAVLGRVVMDGVRPEARELATLVEERWGRWPTGMFDMVWDFMTALDGRTRVQRLGRWYL